MVCHQPIVSTAHRPATTPSKMAWRVMSRRVDSGVLLQTIMTIYLPESGSNDDGAPLVVYGQRILWTGGKPTTSPSPDGGESHASPCRYLLPFAAKTYLISFISTTGHGSSPAGRNLCVLARRLQNGWDDICSGT